MAVAMEVAWRGGGGELGGAVAGMSGSNSKKRAWGADTEKLMHLMMGQFGLVKPAEVTLDLFGAGAGAVASSSSSLSTGGGEGGGFPELNCNSAVEEFFELDPDQPLPSGWEKCLDLKTGEVYFVNKSTGVRASEDPRKEVQGAGPASETLAHEFLGSKMSETLREESLRASSTSSGSSGGSPRECTRPAQLLSFSTGKQHWNLQFDERSTVCLNRTTSPEAPPADDNNSNLELNLNLSAGGNSPSHHHHHQSGVCTMEMVENALKRTEKAMGKREAPSTKRSSGSSSFSSLTSARSEPNSWSHSSSTSSSSSTTSKSHHHDDTLRSSPPGISEAESRKAETTLVMGACTRCLMYVMLHKSDPKCPRCESEVPLDFTTPPSAKRQKVET